MNDFFKIILLYFFVVVLTGCQKDGNKNIFITKEIDLGSVALNDTVSVEVEIVNPFRSDLILKNSASSCGCTGLIITDSILKYNERTIGIIKFIPSINGLTGNVEKAVVLETNSKQRFHEIIIKASVE